MPEISADDGTIHYEVLDATPPWIAAPETILFHHGVAIDSGIWAGWSPSLSDRYRIVTFDVRGYGRSNIPGENFSWSFEQLARDVLAGQPGATIIADVKASQALFDEIARLGGEPLMGRTGHSLIKTKMKETGAPLAGEMSGHIFIADHYYGFDDALYAAVRLLGHVSRSGQTATQLRDGLAQPVNTPEIRIPCSEERKFAVIEEVAERLRVAGALVNDIDGVRVSTDDGWWLLRASNTQDALVARCEAEGDAGLDRLWDVLVGQLDQSNIAAPER